MLLNDQAPQTAYAKSVAVLFPLAVLIAFADHVLPGEGAELFIAIV